MFFYVISNKIITTENDFRLCLIRLIATIILEDTRLSKKINDLSLFNNN